MQSCEAKRHHIFWKGEGKERKGKGGHMCLSLHDNNTRQKGHPQLPQNPRARHIYTSVIIIKRAFFFFMWTWVLELAFWFPKLPKETTRKRYRLPNLFSLLSYFHILEFITHSIQDFPLSNLCISRFAKASHAPQSECSGQLTCNSTNPLLGSVKWKAIHAAPGLGNSFLAA